MLKVITGQNNAAAAYVIPRNQCRVHSAMHYNVQAQNICIQRQNDEIQVTSTHIEESNITQQCTVYRKH